MNGRDSEGLSPAQPLTPREDEILALIGQGKTNRQIAEELTIACSTVKWYVRQIYNKLNVEKREEVIGRARELGLIVGEDGAARHNLPAASARHDWRWNRPAAKYVHNRSFAMAFSLSRWPRWKRPKRCCGNWTAVNPADR